MAAEKAKGKEPASPASPPSPTSRDRGFSEGLTYGLAGMMLEKRPAPPPRPSAASKPSQLAKSRPQESSDDEDDNSNDEEDENDPFADRNAVVTPKMSGDEWSR